MRVMYKHRMLKITKVGTQSRMRVGKRVRTGKPSWKKKTWPLTWIFQGEKRIYSKDRRWLFQQNNSCAKSRESQYIQGTAKYFQKFGHVWGERMMQVEYLIWFSGDFLEFKMESLTFCEIPQLVTTGRPKESTKCGRWNRDWWVAAGRKWALQAMLRRLWCYPQG